jgi:hypothetical protein
MVDRECGGGSAEAWIEDIEDVQRLRAVWSFLARARILDLDCGRGDRLLESAGSLERLYLAAYHRTVSLIDEMAASPIRRRPEHCADLKRTVEAYDLGQPTDDPVIGIRRSIVQSNLFALAHPGSATRACRKRLLRFAARDDGTFRHLDSNVGMLASSEIPWFASLRTAGEVREFGHPCSPTEAEDLDVLRRAWVSAVELRRMAVAEDEDLASAIKQLEARRRALRMCIRRTLASGERRGVIPLLRSMFPWLPPTGNRWVTAATE